MKQVFAGLLLSAALSFGAQLNIGIRIGEPPAPRVVRVRPASPGPDYTWVDGYWYADGGRYHWHNGYWTRVPYAGARWMAPRYEGGMFYSGYWDGDRGRFEHDHQWDRDRDHRDFGRRRDGEHEGERR